MFNLFYRYLCCTSNDCRSLGYSHMRVLPLSKAAGLTCLSPSRSGCLNVNWSSCRTSVWVIPSSWLRPWPVRLLRPRPTTQASSMWCVWSETASPSRLRVSRLETPRRVTSSRPTVTPTSPGVTCVESSSGAFISPVCAVPVSVRRWISDLFSLVNFAASAFWRSECLVEWILTCGCFQLWTINNTVQFYTAGLMQFPVSWWVIKVRTGDSPKI